MNYLGIKENLITDTVEELNFLLASYQVYYQNLRNFHWNIQGENFFDLHDKFEELYNDARIKIDEIAERILTLRKSPLSRLSDYLEHSKVSEAKRLANGREMVIKLLEDHKVMIRQMRRVINKADEAGDEGTIDMIGGFLSNLEKKSWMLDAWASLKLEPAIS